MADRCLRPFPTGKWQIVHSIEAVTPTGEHVVFTGVSILSDNPGSLTCVLMTQEGFVLFEGAYRGTLTIRRALPPFDRPGFAEGLMDDVRLLLMKPESTPSLCGRTGEDACACRFTDPSGGTTDIVMGTGNTWTLNRYDGKNRLKRTVTAITGSGKGIEGCPLPERCILTSPGVLGYTLTLTLIDAVHVNP
jgi:hypothetical protein